MGAWIEIRLLKQAEIEHESLPMWERGLKYAIYDTKEEANVAPHVGAWIEIRQ